MRGWHYAAYAAFVVLLTACQSSSAAHRAPPSTTGSAATTTVVPTPKSTTTTTTLGAHPTTQRPEPPLPMALQEGGAAVVGADLYEVAGYDVNRLSTSDVFVFDGSAW